MTNSAKISSAEVVAAIDRVAKALQTQSDYLTTLDQAMGDGDLGITTSKIGVALEAYLADANPDDLGKYLMTAGMKINSAAPSTMGTLLATGLMRAGKEAKDKQELDGPTLATMLKAADQGIQERGKAKPGDKTIVDALHPAAESFAQAIYEGDSLKIASKKMLAAAEQGLESVTPLQSKVGRASWVGERTKDRVDPGCATLVVILKAIMNS